MGASGYRTLACRVRDAAGASNSFGVGRGDVLLEIWILDVPAEARPLLSQLATAQSRRGRGGRDGGQARAQLRGSARHRFRYMDSICREKHKYCHESRRKQAWRWGAMGWIGHDLQWGASDRRLEKLAVVLCCMAKARDGRFIEMALQLNVVKIILNRIF